MGWRPARLLEAITGINSIKDFTPEVLEEIIGHLLNHIMRTSKLVPPMWRTQQVQEVRRCRLETFEQVLLLREAHPEQEVPTRTWAEAPGFLVCSRRPKRPDGQDLLGRAASRVT